MFASEFLGADGAKIAMLDNGTMAIGIYAVYTSTNVPVRLLVINSNYFNGSGIRSTATVQVSLTDLLPTTTNTTLQAKRMTAASALSEVDQGAVVTIGGSPSFSSDCEIAGTQVTENVGVSGGVLSVLIHASEAMIVYL